MLEEILRSGFAEMGIAADDAVISRFRTYHDALREANQVMNLTAITGEAETARLHFLDSAAPLRLFPMDKKRVIDVGTGAGFPGLPLKLLCPSLSLTLLDSLRKRVDFLKVLCARLGMEDTACIHGRAEEPGSLRDTYDFAVSRAVARLNVLCELCLPYVSPGGAFLALKGPAAPEELAEASRAISLLGGQAEQIFEYAVPGTELRHNVVVIRKTAATPAAYPRKFALIKKSPL